MSKKRIKALLQDSAAVDGNGPTLLQRDAVDKVDKRDAAAAVAEGTMRIECLLYARCSELLQTRGKLGSIGLRTPPCPAAAAAMHCCQGP
jgi:hypothetical protein